MRIEQLPNMVFIVGGPRCGTTTLSSWLKQQPEICFPFVKEPHFFAQYDLTAMDDAAARELIEREFLDRFYSQCEGQEKAAGLDGSVSYLYIPERLVPALRFWPNAKFVIAVRDPMSMLPSLHQRLRVTGDENIPSFEEAWDAVADRAAGRRIPSSCLEPRWLRYDEGGKLGTYTQKMFDLIGRDRCFVSVFDDLVSDSPGQYLRLIDFLGFQPVDGIELKSKRGGQSFRYFWLQRLLKRPPKFARTYLAGKHFAQREKSLSGDEEDAVATRIFSIRKRLLRWNKVPAVKQPIPLRVQQEIRDTLKDDIAHLGRLLDRDLSHWLDVRGGRLG
ncbi:sulfotransferase family protein [Sphingomonas jaspsi]|uniref:sulfotransferase family protein n=1 Tax=Sphingomonas jaspsi TaxID=392409 RepID=UPI0004AE017E|nr:sulfotransferase [Sphingomonas jaspsi]